MLRFQSGQLAEDRKVNAEQIRVLGLQAEEPGQVSADREREAQERHRPQAVLVYRWAERVFPDETGIPFSFVAHIRNTSQQPLSGLRFRFRLAGQFDVQDVLHAEPLMPGRADDATLPVPAWTRPGHYGAVVIFGDRAGTWWCTRPDGRASMRYPSPRRRCRPTGLPAVRLPDKSLPDRRL